MEVCALGEGWQQVMSCRRKVTRRAHPQKIRTGRLLDWQVQGLVTASRVKARKGRAGEMRILDKRLTENHVKTNTSINAN